MQTVKAALVAAIAIVALVISLLPGLAEESGSLAVTISIDGPIGPASASYVKDALATAGKRRAEIVILRLNTPGGLNTSMREIIADVLASPVPIIGYVAPSGAHAASAGTYIIYATHIAVMAPGTNIGAATPVQIGGPIPGLPSVAPDREGKDKKNGERQPEPKDAMTAKATNDAVAFIRSLAELRGRNADWAEKAVREAATLSANGALQANVIDLIARDPAELLRQIDDRAVEVAGGKTQRLVTKGCIIEAIDPGWISRRRCQTHHPPPQRIGSPEFGTYGRSWSGRFDRMSVCGTTRTHGRVRFCPAIGDKRTSILPHLTASVCSAFPFSPRA